MKRPSFSLWLFVLGCMLGSAARAESYYALRLPPPLALKEGWWRGFVMKGGWPTEFFLEVRGAALESASVTLHSEVSTWELAGLCQEGRALTIPGRLQGEYLTGELRDGTFVGRYYPSPVDSGGGRSFFFQAHASSGTTAPQLGEVWNLSGVWRVRIQDRPEVDALFSHNGKRVRGLLRESGPGSRFFDGFLSGNRFALEGIGGASLLQGRYEPGGVLRGEIVTVGGRATFSAQRKQGDALLNLTGRQ